MSYNYLGDLIYNFMGVDCTESKELLSFLIDSEASFKEFMDEFYNGNALESVMAYKNYKRKIHSMSEQEFKKAIEQEDVLSVFQKIFQEPLSKQDIDQISKNNLTYTDIFKRYQSHPYESFNNLVKGNYLESNCIDDSFLIEL